MATRTWFQGSWQPTQKGDSWTTELLLSGRRKDTGSTRDMLIDLGVMGSRALGSMTWGGQ